MRRNRMFSKGKTLDLRKDETRAEPMIFNGYEANNLVIILKK